MDEDLNHFTESQLIAEVKRLRAGIRQHRDSTGHDLCWHHPQLWGLLPEQVTPDLAVPAWPQFLRGCLRYRESLDAQLPNAPRLTEEYGNLDKSAASLTNLMAADFSTMNDLQHKEKLVAMMQALYAEDKSELPVDQSRFAINVETLVAKPSVGCIVLFRQGEHLCGYAPLIPYWSNEFGGTVLFVDEMFVIPDVRNRGIGRSFFKFLDQTRPFGPVALALEVSPDNTGALRLYESLGFRQQRNLVLNCSLTDDPTKGL
jgi:GNAT superfamily N-acetyltransferase